MSLAWTNVSLPVQRHLEIQSLSVARNEVGQYSLVRFSWTCSYLTLPSLCRPQQNLHPVDQSQDATSILHYSHRFCFIHCVSDSRDFLSSNDAGLYCLPVWNWHTSFTKQYMKYVSHFYSKYIHLHFATFYNWQTLWNIMEKMLFIGIVMKQQHTNVQCMVKTLYLSDSWIVDQGMHMFSGQAIPVHSGRSTMKMLF